MDKSHSQDTVIKATMWYTASSILLKGVSFFTAPIFTRLLSTADYGYASNFMACANIISCFAGLGLSTAVLRGKMEFDNKYKQYLSSIQTLSMLSTIVCFSFIFMGINFWSSLLELDLFCIVAMMVYLLFNPSVGFMQINYRFDYRYKENVTISAITMFGSILISIGLIFLLPNKRYIGRILGTIVPLIIFGIIFILKIYKSGKCLYNKEFWIYALKLSLPMIPHGVAMIILAQIDRVMIIKYCGQSEAGIYSFGYSYAIILSVITNAINDAVQPQMYQMLKKKEDKKLALFTNNIIIGILALSIAIIAIAPEMLKILGTSSYYDARWIVFPVVAGTFMQFIYQNFGVVEIFYKKTKYMAVGSIGAALINLALNKTFIPLCGYQAAAYTTLISYAILMLFHYIASNIAAKRQIFNAISIIFYSCVLIILGMIFNVFYDNLLIYRVGLLTIVMLSILLVKRNEIKICFEYIQKKLK